MQLEPKIIINGTELNEAQAMTVRVAIQRFAVDLKDNGLGEDETGLAIAAGYRARIADLNALMDARRAPREEREAKALLILQEALIRVDKLGVYAYHRPGGPEHDSMEMAPHRVEVHSKSEHELGIDS